MMRSAAINIGDKAVGDGQPVFIIAEAGVNHNGDLGMARQLVRAAKEAGADCVKFQTFKAENLVTRQAPKAEYQLRLTDPKESQFTMLKNLELSFDAYTELIQMCRDLDIVFLSTPYNFSDVDFLEKAGVPGYKLASMHLTELPMIEYAAKKNKPILLSTGMGTLADVVTAADAFQKTGNDKLVLLQCTTDYPAKLEEANLRAIATIRRATDTIVGYSDNSDSNDACVLAVAVGACVIEKHFTLDKNLPGPDHAASANPEEFALMVKKIRAAELALGSSEKIVTTYEKRNMVGMKRSVTSMVAIPAGTIITSGMIDFKRPATGLAPNEYSKIVGHKAKKDIAADQTLTRDDIIW